MGKKLNFKKLLATASAFAVITGASNSAMGANRTTANGGESNVGTRAHWNDGNAAGNAAVASSDNLIITHQGDVINIDVAKFYIAQVSVDTNLGGTLGGIRVNDDGTLLGSVRAVNAGNAVNAAAFAGVLTFGDEHDITLVGGTDTGHGNPSVYDGLKGVDFANAASILTIDTRVAVLGTAGPNDDIDLAGTAANAVNATLNVNTSLNVVDESWGAVKTINIGEAANDATFKIESNVADIALNTAGANTVNFLHNDSALHLKNKVGATDVIIQNGHIGGDGDLNGRLIIESNGAAMAVNAANGATIGKDIDNRLQKLEFIGDNELTVVAKVYAKTIDYGVTVGAKALVFGAEVHGGENSLLTFTNDNATSVVFNENAQITLIDFANRDKGVTVADDKVLTASLTGDNAANNVAGSLTFLGKGELAGVATNLTAVIANGAGAVTIGEGDHKVTTFKAANGNAQFNFADGANVDGAIDNTVVVGATKLNFAGDSTVTGNIGTSNAFSQVNIGEGTVAIGADLKAINVNFADSEDSILQIQGNGNAAHHTIIGNISENGNKGTIKIAGDVAANNVTFASEIGDDADAGKKLKRLEIENGFTGQVRLDKDTHITDVQIGGGSIRLVNQNYKFGGITSANGDGNGTLLVDANNANLVGRAAPADAVINLGTSESRLAKLEFGADNTLNIGDGVNIHVNEIVSNGAGAHQGTLVFKGASIFESLAQNNGDTLTAITLDANANVTILSPNTAVNGLTELGDNSTLAIAGNFDSKAHLQGVNDAVGTTLKFINANKATITGDVGANGKSLASIEFAGGDVEFSALVNHKAGQAFVFSGDTASTVTFDAFTNVGDNVFINNSDTTSTVVIQCNMTDFNKNLATSVDHQLNFQLSNGVDAKITGGDAAGTNFTTSADKTGALELSKDGTVINSAGEFNKSLAKVEITNSATITNNIYAEEVQVAAGETAILGGTIKSDNFHLDGIAAKTVFSDGATVDSIIKTTVAGKGLVEFAGGATISKDLGTGANALNTVTFANDAEKTALLGANIFATNITMQQGVVKLTSDAELNGVTNATDANIDLEDKRLTANDNLIFNGVNNIEFSTTNTGSDLTGGQITIAADKNMVFVAGTELAITANDKGNARPTGGGSHDFTLIDGDVFAVAGSKLDISKVTVDNTNAFTRWTVAIGEKNNNRLILTQTDNAAGALKEIVGATDAANMTNIDALADADLNTEGYKVVTLLSTLTDNADKSNETLNRLSSPVRVADEIENTAANVSAALDARTMSLAGRQGHPAKTTTIGSAHVVGVSAGDDHARFGAWFSPFYNNTTQKARKGAAGYKGESYGASFGFDTRTNEDTIIGAAFTAANSELKHKNFKSGDKTKVNSLLFSIYGMHQITDTWFTLGSATIGTNEVKNNERKVSGATSYETASAKYGLMVFSGEVMFGYNHITEQATITPMGGFRYTRVSDGGYKETGTSFQNLDVSTKAANKFEVILGAKASGGTFDLNGMSVTPEVHAFINHDLINKNSKQSIKLGSTTLAGKSSKPVRTTYNLGLGANAEFGIMEYGASYDAQLANKRVGHQGSLRLRVNF